MFVYKRDGRKERVLFDKITSRIQKLCYGLNLDYIDPAYVTMKVINGVYSGVTTVELDMIAAEICIELSNKHPDYAVLAARIEVSNLHKETKKTFSDVMEDIYTASNDPSSTCAKMDLEFYELTCENSEILNSAIIYDRDFSFSYLSVKGLENEFLTKINGKIVERPQHMFMRVALAIHKKDIESVIETYNQLSEKHFTVSALALKNSGFNNGAIFDLYSTSMRGDSIEGIYGSLKDCGYIARRGGTVGLNVHCIRSKGTYIVGTNGTSNGLAPMLRVFDSLANFVHTGNDKRTSDVTIYLEPWHSDIFDFLALKKTTGKNEHRARTLQYAMWIPDIFMKRTEADGPWSLMCPNESQKLQKLWGSDFDELYKKFENEGRFIRQVKAREVWSAIIQSQIETGGPIMMYKDNINKKSNLMNAGPILGSSHNGELLAFTSPEEFPASGSAFVNLGSFVDNDKSFNFLKFSDVVKSLTKTLNNMIDANPFSVKESLFAASRQRPLAIGVQGFADALILMQHSFDCAAAKELNKEIFETLYFSALEASCDLAAQYGPYELFPNSPLQKGVFQHDMWDENVSTVNDWSQLKEKIQKYGVRNAVLVGFSSCSKLGRVFNCVPACEPLSSNVHTISLNEDKNLKLINDELVKHLNDLNIWDESLERQIIEHDGSLQDIEAIPDKVKSIFKTSWELSQKDILSLTADRAPFIDQTQSINIRIMNPNYGKITSMHFFCWNAGLKCGLLKLETKSVEKSKSPESSEANVIETSVRNQNDAKFE